LIAGGVFIVGAFLSFVRGWLFGLGGERIVAKLRCDLFAAMMEQEMGFFHSTRTGELVNRLSADCTLIQIATTVTFAMLWRFILQVVGGIAILFAIAPILTLVMLAPIPVLAVGSYFYGGFVKRLAARVQTALAATTAVAEESISMIQFVKTFAGEPREVEKFAVKVNDSFLLGRRMAWAFGLFQALVEFASYVCILLVIW
jgi:ABC-type multidrug transport system fused ATPase/permease subunit